MNRILSLVRRCVEDYDMIQPDDRVAVGVSGGKDSLTLLVALAKLREFYPIPFTVEAFTLTWGRQRAGPGWTFLLLPSCAGRWRSPTPSSAVRSSTSFLMCGRRKTPAPCVPRCGGGPLHSAHAGAGHPQDRTGPPLR